MTFNTSTILYLVGYSYVHLVQLYDLLVHHLYLTRYNILLTTGTSAYLLFVVPEALFLSFALFSLRSVFAPHFFFFNKNNQKTCDDRSRVGKTLFPPQPNPLSFVDESWFIGHLFIRFSVQPLRVLIRSCSFMFVHVPSVVLKFEVLFLLRWMN